MEIKELVERLKLIAQLDGDPEVAHSEADAALLKYIGNNDVAEAYDSIKKWYA